MNNILPTDLKLQKGTITQLEYALAFVLGTAFWVWLFFGIGALKGEF